MAGQRPVRKQHAASKHPEDQGVNVFVEKGTTMRKQVLLLLLAVAGVLSACTAQQSPRLAGQSPMSAERALQLAKQPPLPASACAEWRLIGIRSRSAAECPAVPGWRVDRLFAPARKEDDQLRNGYGQPAAAKAGDREISADAAKRELDRFCTYERDDDSRP